MKFILLEKTSFHFCASQHLLSIMLGYPRETSTINLSLLISLPFGINMSKGVESITEGYQ